MANYEKNGELTYIDEDGNSYVLYPSTKIENVQDLMGALDALNTHARDKENPHGVTAEQIGALEMELLWENTSPTSSFPAQTITLPDNDAELFLVTFHSSNGIDHPSIFMEVGHHAEICRMSSSGSYQTGSAMFVNRYINGNTQTSMTFTDAKQVPLSGSTWSTYNNHLKPTNIYGIKGVRA